MRRAFTLIEMMVVIAIIGIVSGLGVLSITSGKGAARVKGATRDVYAAIRHARSIALVTGQRVLVNYSNETVDDEIAAKVDVVAAKIMDTGDGSPDAMPYYVMDYKDLPQSAPRKAGQKLVNIRDSKAKSFVSDGETAAESGSDEGETVEEILFSPMGENIVRGMRILVKKGDEALADETDVQMKSRISVFSNVDYLQGRYREAKAAEEAKEESKGLTSGGGAASPLGGSANDMEGTVSVVWETNGAVEPHKIWIYQDGEKPENGLMLNVDRFGAIKVLNGDGKDEE